MQWWSEYCGSFHIEIACGVWYYSKLGCGVSVTEAQTHLTYMLISVRLWNFKDGGSLKARFLQCGDQVSRISFDFLKSRSMGPQKLATIIGHKYSIFKPSKKNKGVFLIIKIRQIIRSKKISKISIFWGHEFQKLC